MLDFCAKQKKFKQCGDLMRLFNSYHPYAMLSVVFWSLAFVLTRLTLQYFSAFSIGFLRYFIAACIFAAMVFWGKIKRPNKADFKYFLFSGFFGFFFYMIAFNKGLETLTSAAGSVIIAIVPVITAIMARVVYKEKLHIIQWAAIAVEFSGVIVLTMMNDALSFNRGIIWMLLAAFSFAVYNILQRKLTKTYSGLQSSAYGIFIGTAMLAVFLPASLYELPSATPLALIYVAILGIFSSAVAFATWAQAFKKAEKSSQVSNYMFVTPFLAALSGFVLAGERPDFSTITGGTIILIGMFIFNFGSELHRRILHKV